MKAQDEAMRQARHLDEAMRQEVLTQTQTGGGACVSDPLEQGRVRGSQPLDHHHV